MKTSERVHFKGFDFDVYVDGSGFAGSGTVSGWKVGVVASSIVRAHLVDAGSSRKPAKWIVRFAEKLGKELFESLPAPWHEMNRAMYA